MLSPSRTSKIEIQTKNTHFFIMRAIFCCCCCFCWSMLTHIMFNRHCLWVHTHTHTYLYTYGQHWTLQCEVHTNLIQKHTHTYTLTYTHLCTDWKHEWRQETINRAKQLNCLVRCFLFLCIVKLNTGQYQFKYKYTTNAYIILGGVFLAVRIFLKCG